MKIAIIKPDFKIQGGFETVIERVSQDLVDQGWEVDTIFVDMKSIQNDIIAPQIYEKNKQFFDYALSIKKFQKLDLKKYDLTISTQPPSYCIDHKKNLILFYHHMKIYYDLYDLIMETNLIQRKYHRLAAKYIRDIEGLYLTEKRFFAAGSQTIKKRLREYNGIEKNVFQFSAGIDESFYKYQGPKTFQNPICVGRHEFPKRTELFIQAMKYLDIDGTVIGSGGQSLILKDVDTMLTYVYNFLNEEIESEKLYKEIIFHIEDSNIAKMKKTLADVNIKSNVFFAGRTSMGELTDHYASALCVVCPAYEEDYGLTAIEAMAFGKPVIACRDGGGYCELIEHERTGFIVDPDAKEIAKHIRYLYENPDILHTMSMNAYHASRKYSWKNALAEFNKIIKKVMEC